MKTLWLAAIATVVLGAACARPEHERDLVEIRRSDLVIDVAITGELEATDSADVRAPVFSYHTDFKVSWLASDGADVKAGDKIVAFSEDELDRNLEAMHGEAAEEQQRVEAHRHDFTLARQQDALRLLAAQVDATKADLKVDVPSDLVAALELRTRKLDDELAHISLTQTEQAAAFSRASDATDLSEYADSHAATLSKIAESERYVPLLTVVAPRSGTVVLENRGANKLKVGDSIYEHDVAARIVGADAMIGAGIVDEIDIGTLAATQPVTLRLDAFPDLDVHATVSAVTTTVQPRSPSDPSNVVHVKLAISPTRGVGLRSGMRFHGQIETQRVRDAVQIPSEAVFVGADGPVAYRETDSGLERVHLELGRRSPDVIEVVSGLAAGDLVSRVDPDQEAP